MKKITFFLAATLGLVSFAAQAQQARINIKLHPIQTIIVNAGTRVVNLDYKTSDDYANGVETTKEDHLTVYSTGGFAVKVKSDNLILERINTTGTESIDASDIHITASAGTNNDLDTGGYKTVKLSTSAQELYANTTGGTNINFDVNYKALGDANAYVNKYFNVEKPTVYTTTVTYSIEAR